MTRNSAVILALLWLECSRAEGSGFVVSFTHIHEAGSWPHTIKGPQLVVNFPLVRFSAHKMTGTIIRYHPFCDGVIVRCKATPPHFLHTSIHPSTELSVSFVNSSPQLNMSTLTAQFVANRPGVDIFCHITRLDTIRENCKHIQSNKHSFRALSSWVYL